MCVRSSGAHSSPGSPGTEGTGHCEPSCQCWDPNPGPLRATGALSPEQSLQTPLVASFLIQLHFGLLGTVAFV